MARLSLPGARHASLAVLGVFVALAGAGCPAHGPSRNQARVQQQQRSPSGNGASERFLRESAGTMFVRGEGQRLVVSFVESLTAEQMRNANRGRQEYRTHQGPEPKFGDGLPYSGLAAQQQETLRSLWEMDRQLAQTDAPSAAKAARQARHPAEWPQAQILNGGYFVWPSGALRHTVVAFQVQRGRVLETFGTRLPSGKQLTPALKNGRVWWGKDAFVSAVARWHPSARDWAK